MSSSGTMERSAQRLVRCYPKGWRARYGDEFTQLLIDELTNGEMSVARKLDVLAHGAWTRITYTGLAGSVLDAQGQMRSMLGALFVVSAVFVMLAAAVWAQLTVGWEWSAPSSGETTAAMGLMSAGLFGLCALAVLVTALLVVLSLGIARRGGIAGWWPVIVSLGAGAVLYLGCRHFGPHWPGTGGHPWSGRGLAPTWLARLSWAETLWITSYWAHPVALESFPAGELAWMVISPAAWFALILSAAATARRLDPTPQLRRLAILACAVMVMAMVVFLVGAAVWVCSDNSGPRSMFAAGAIDLAIVVILAVGLIATTHLLRRVAASTPTTVAH